MSLLLIAAAQLGACSSEPEAEEPYLAGIKAVAQGDADEALGSCLLVSEEALRGDCLAATVGVTSLERLDAVPCGELGSATWHDECLFSKGERALELGDEELAIAYCEEAGTFREDCFTHLWKATVLAINKSGLSASEALIEAHRAFGRLGEDVTIRSREGLDEWSVVSRQVFSRRLEYSPEDCEVIPSDMREGCRTQQAQVAGERLAALSPRSCAVQEAIVLLVESEEPLPPPFENVHLSPAGAETFGLALARACTRPSRKRKKPQSKS